MEDNKKNIFQENQEMVKIIGFALIGLFLIIIIIILLIFMNQPSNNADDSDPFSDQTINTTDSGVIIVGVNQISEKAANKEAVLDAVEVMKTFFDNSFPNLKTVTVIEDTIKPENDNYLSFSMVSNINQEFQVVIEGVSAYDYHLTIKRQDSTLLDYNSPKTQKVGKNIDDIANYLPYFTSINDDLPVTFLQYRESGQLIYEISVNSCGDEEIKDKAISLVSKWLAQKGYNLESIDYRIPDYCDDDF